MWRKCGAFSTRANLKRPSLMGDFNDSPGSLVAEWLEAQGLRNALMEADANAPTWRWKTSGITLSRQMDHIFYSPSSIAPRPGD
ncbi:MAG TPA: endonuclease/exonuclease/phosphatase family protein [Verrucomicrobiota bacterium]|nr:endonuclease/exonuclease/phosphatase family protein [Verrucomicrobiota bacterium]